MKYRDVARMYFRPQSTGTKPADEGTTLNDVRQALTEWLTPPQMQAIGMAGADIARRLGVDIPTGAEDAVLGRTNTDRMRRMLSGYEGGAEYLLRGAGALAKGYADNADARNNPNGVDNPVTDASAMRTVGDGLDWLADVLREEQESPIRQRAFHEKKKDYGTFADMISDGTLGEYLTDPGGAKQDLDIGVGNALFFMTLAKAFPTLSFGGKLEQGVSGALGSGIANTTRGLLGKAGLHNAARIAGGKNAEGLLSSAIEFAPTMGLGQAIVNAGSIVDPLRQQGYSDAEIYNRQKDLIADELPADMAFAALTGNVLKGNLGRAIAGRNASIPKLAAAQLPGLGLETTGGFYSNLYQMMLANKYSGQPYGEIFGEHMPNEIEAGNLGALMGAMFGATGVPSAVGNARASDAYANAYAKHSQNVADRYHNARDEAPEMARQAYRDAADERIYWGNGGKDEGKTWFRQGDNVSLNGAQPDLMNAIDSLADWLYKKTGRRLVVTSGTNGDHPSNSSEHGHSSGWKVDVVDEYNDGEDSDLITADFQKGKLADEFIAYGRSLGLGMNFEDAGTDNVHFDVALDGTQWDGYGEDAGGFRGGGKQSARTEQSNTYDNNFTPRQNEVWQAAQYASQRAKEKYNIDIPAELIYRQWTQEAGANFDSPNARYNNNFGGLTQTEPNGEENKQPDGNNYYRHYNNLQEYADSYVDDFIRYRPELNGVKTVREFAQIMHDTGYFGDSVENYTAGMEGAQVPQAGRERSVQSRADEIFKQRFQDRMNPSQQQQRIPEPEPIKTRYVDTRAEDDATQKLFDQFAQERLAKAVESKNVDEASFWSRMFNDDSTFNNTKENRDAIREHYGEDLSQFIAKTFDAAETPKEQPAQTQQGKPQPKTVQATPQGNKGNSVLRDNPVITAGNKYLEELRATGKQEEAHKTFQLLSALQKGDAVEVENILKKNGREDLIQQAQQESQTQSAQQEQQPAQTQENVVQNNTTPENVLARRDAAIGDMRQTIAALKQKLNGVSNPETKMMLNGQISHLEGGIEALEEASGNREFGGKPDVAKIAKVLEEYGYGDKSSTAESETQSHTKEQDEQKTEQQSKQKPKNAPETGLEKAIKAAHGELKNSSKEKRTRIGKALTFIADNYGVEIPQAEREALREKGDGKLIQKWREELMYRGHLPPKSAIKKGKQDTPAQQQPQTQQPQTQQEQPQPAQETLKQPSLIEQARAIVKEATDAAQKNWEGIKQGYKERGITKRAEQDVGTEVNDIDDMLFRDDETAEQEERQTQADLNLAEKQANELAELQTRQAEEKRNAEERQRQDAEHEKEMAQRENLPNDISNALAPASSNNVARQKQGNAIADLINSKPFQDMYGTIQLPKGLEQSLRRGDKDAIKTAQQLMQRRNVRPVEWTAPDNPEPIELVDESENESNTQPEFEPEPPYQPKHAETTTTYPEPEHVPQLDADSELAIAPVAHNPREAKAQGAAIMRLINSPQFKAAYGNIKLSEPLQRALRDGKAKGIEEAQRLLAERGVARQTEQAKPTEQPRQEQEQPKPEPKKEPQKKTEEKPQEEPSREEDETKEEPKAQEPKPETETKVAAKAKPTPKAKSTMKEKILKGAEALKKLLATYLPLDKYPSVKGYLFDEIDAMARNYVGLGFPNSLKEFNEWCQSTLNSMRKLKNPDEWCANKAREIAEKEEAKQAREEQRKAREELQRFVDDDETDIEKIKDAFRKAAHAAVDFTKYPQFKSWLSERFRMNRATDPQSLKRYLGKDLGRLREDLRDDFFRTVAQWAYCDLQVRFQQEKLNKIPQFDEAYDIAYGRNKVDEAAYNRVKELLAQAEEELSNKQELKEDVAPKETTGEPKEGKQDETTEKTPTEKDRPAEKDNTKDAESGQVEEEVAKPKAEEKATPKEEAKYNEGTSKRQETVAEEREKERELKDRLYDRKQEFLEKQDALSKKMRAAAKAGNSNEVYRLLQEMNKLRKDYDDSLLADVTEADMARHLGAAKAITRAILLRRIGDRARSKPERERNRELHRRGELTEREKLLFPIADAFAKRVVDFLVAENGKMTDRWFADEAKRYVESEIDRLMSDGMGEWGSLAVLAILGFEATHPQVQYETLPSYEKASTLYARAESKAMKGNVEVKKEQALKIVELISKAEAEFKSTKKKSLEENADTRITNLVADKDLTPQQKLLKDFAAKLGVPIQFFDNPDGRFHGAFVDGITFLNVNSKKGLDGVFWHESFHWLKANNPELYAKLVDAAGITDAQRKAFLERTGRKDLTTDEAIDEEILADQMDDVAKRTGLLQNLAGKNRGLVERVVQWLKDTMNKFIEMFRNPTGRLTTKQAQALADEFGKIARSLKDANGNQIFRVNNRTGNIEVIGGRTAPQTSTAKATAAAQSPAAKYSIDPADNSNESWGKRLKNWMTGLTGSKKSPERIHQEMKRRLEDLSNMKIAAGHLPKGMQEQIDEVARVIRTKKEYDWARILPHVGNSVAAQLGITQSTEMSNCIAKYLHDGVVDEQSAEGKEFIQAMRNNEELRDKIIATQEVFGRWREMDDVQRQVASIQFGKPQENLTLKGRGVKFWRELRRQLFDAQAPIGYQVEHFEKATGMKLADSLNPEVAFRNLRGTQGIALSMIDGGREEVEVLQGKIAGVNFDNFQTVAETLYKAGAFENDQNYKEFSDFVTLKQILTLHKHNDNNRAAQAEIRKKIAALKEELELASTKKEHTKLEQSIERKERALSNLQDSIKELPEAWDTKEKCENALAKLTSKHGDKFEKAQKALVEYTKVLMAMRVDAGLMSTRRFNELLHAFPDYVPLHRIFDENPDIEADSDKHMVGSGKDIIDPIQAIMDNTFDIVHRCEKNKAKQLLATLARFDGVGRIFEEVEPGTNDGTIINFYEGGKRKCLQCADPALAKAVNNLAPAPMNWAMKLFRVPTLVLKGATTALSPSFMARNIFRDPQDAYVYSAKNGGNIFKDALKYMTPLFALKCTFDTLCGNNKTYEALINKLNMEVDKKLLAEYRIYGGSQSTFFDFDANVKADLFAKYTKGKWKRFASPKGVIQLLEKLGELSERGTRLQRFKQVKDNLKTQHGGINIYDDLVTAAFESRDLMDFARHGEAGHTWNTMAAFANPALQGIDKLIRTFDVKKLKMFGGTEETQKQWMSSLARLAIGSILPALVLTMLHKDEDWYKDDLQPWEKDAYWILGENLKIPKGADVATRFFSNLAEALVNSDNEPIKAKRILMPLYDGLPNLLPTAMAPVIECFFNKDLFKGTPIIPMRERYLSATPEKQYDSSNSNFAIWLGNKLGVSPRYVDHIIYGYTGNLGKGGMKVVDTGLHATGLSDKPVQPWTQAWIPVVGGFLREPYANSKIVKDYYTELDQQRSYVEAYKLDKKNRKKDAKLDENFDRGWYARLTGAEKAMGEFAKRERAILDNPNLTSEQVEEQRRKIQEKRIALLRRIFKYKRAQ